MEEFGVKDVLYQCNAAVALLGLFEIGLFQISVPMTDSQELDVLCYGSGSECGT